MKNTLSFHLFTLVVVATCFLAWSSGPVLADQVTFDWATVGNAGNAADTHGAGYGAVDYNYRISKHEVTNAQYSTFLNAVAATDSFALYNTNMGSNPRGGISRSGSSGSYTYSVRENMGNKPVNYVSFFDAMRFINWLENGQGAGNTEAGVYAIGNGLNETRATGARFFITSEDEWYKAAYHKNDGVTGNYWDYPTSSDTIPIIATADMFGNISNPGSNVANYNNGADWNGRDGNVTTVGSALSTSPYGTFDQGGNVWEWNEAVIISSSRGLRGGSWDAVLSRKGSVVNARRPRRSGGFLARTPPAVASFQVAPILRTSSPG